VPELTLLFDRLPSPAAQSRHSSRVKSICSSAEQMQSTAGCTATSSIEAVVTSVSDSVNSLQIKSSDIMQHAARQLPVMKKLYQPVTAANIDRENNMNPCCHHCTSCQTKLSSDERNKPYADKHSGTEKGLYNVTYATNNSVHMSTPASVCVQLPVVSDSMSSPGACADSLRTLNVSVSSAARVPMHCQSAVPLESLTAAELTKQPLVAHGVPRHMVQNVHLPALTASSYGPPSHSGQPVTSAPRQNGQFHRCSLAHGPRFVQASHQHHASYEVQGSDTSCNNTGCYSESAQWASQHPVMPVRFLPPASHAGVRQPRHISPTYSSRLPMKVKGKSAADQSDCRCCVPHSSPPAAANVMQCAQVHQPSPVLPVASQHGKLPGSSKAFRCAGQPNSPSLGPQCNVLVCQQSVLYDSGRCASESSLALMNDSHHSDHQVDMQQLSSRSLTPADSVATTSSPRTVDDLLQTVRVQNGDRSAVPLKDFTTVDDFVESVLVHHSASTDSGLQVNDSAASADTPPMISLAVDNCNNVLHHVDDSMARSDDGSSQRSLNVKKCRKMVAESDVCGHLGYFKDKPEVTGPSEQFSSADNHPKLCSVAVNTSLYWPPADIGSTQNNVAGSSALPIQNDAQCLKSVDAGYNDNTVQAAIDMAVRRNSGCARDADTPGVGVLQRLLVSSRDTELVNDTCDSTADISLCTPPPPVFPSPSEESVVSEMIMDMPEYSTLSQEKWVILIAIRRYIG